MPHRKTQQLIATLTLSLGAFALVAAGPLGAIKDAANDSRDQMEQAQEKTTQMADNNPVTVREGEAGDMTDSAKDLKQKGEDAMHDAMKHGDDADANQVTVDRAVAVLMPLKGSNVRGSITFTQTEAGVKVTANVTGLQPNSRHGFHVHEFGDPSSEDGSAMGGHYNPEGHDHALPTSGDMQRHAGDFGNLEADAQGNATFDMTFDNISLFNDEHNPIIGRGLIVHEKPDDGGQPTGNAGGRIAQAVIGVAR